MAETIELFDQHSLRFPYSYCMFGKTFEMICEAQFGYRELKVGFKINVTSLTATQEDGSMVCMMYLIEEEEDLSEFIMRSIVGNKDGWDSETDWWLEDPMGDIKNPPRPPSNAPIGGGGGNFPTDGGTPIALAA